MLYCPRCRATYKEGTVRFCTNDNTRLVPGESKEKSTEEPKKGLFTNILSENLLFGEDEWLQPKAKRKISSSSHPKKAEVKREPRFAPSFEPPKGSRFFKSDEDDNKFGLDVAEEKIEETMELDLGESETSSEERATFKDVNLAGVVDLGEDTESDIEEVVEKEEIETFADQVTEEDQEIEEVLFDEEVEIETVEDNVVEEVIEKQVVEEEEEIEEQVVEEEKVVDKKEVIEEKALVNLVGLELNNRYKVIEKLGQDEVGTAYLAKDKIALNKRVVVTVFADSEAGEAEGIGNAKELLTEIKHPNIEIVLSTGKLPSGNSFVISEFLEGNPLSDAIGEDKQFNIERTAQIIRQISYGLNELHQKGFIYRNLRPESIVLCVSDAGTEQVKILNPAVSVGEINSGNLNHKSPEEIEKNIITIASDTYSLGSIGYLMLTGQMPFEGANADELFESQKKRLKFPPSKLRSDLPDSIDEVLKKTLAFNPADRYIQARHFGDDFYDALIPSIDEEESVSVSSSKEQTGKPFAVVPETVVDEQESVEAVELVGGNVEDSQAISETGTPENLKDFESIGDILESAPISAALKSGIDDVFELDMTGENVSTEFDETESGIVTKQDEIFELDASETLADIELDLGEAEEPKTINQQEFELDFDAMEDTSADMPLDAATSSVLSDINLDFDTEQSADQTLVETLPEIELDLEGSDKTREIVVMQETLPAIEFDLDEIDKKTQLEVLEEIVPKKEVRKPKIRIISPEKPYYRNEKIEEVAENTKEEKGELAVIPAGSVETTTDSEVGKKVVGDIEEEKDYSWVLLPLLLLLLLIAVIAAFWYFGGQGQGMQPQNTNTGANNQIISPDQSLSGGQIDGNDVAGDSENSNSKQDFFGEDYGVPGGSSGETASENSTYTLTNPKPPPSQRNIEKAEDMVRFKNTKKKTPRNLKNDFLGFTIDYPKDWKKNSTRNNFLDITKDAKNGSPIKQLLITEYDSTGTYEGDRELFKQLAEKSNKDLEAILPNYNMISEAETSIQDGRWRIYEVKFRGSGISRGKKLTVWGRRLWIPVQRLGMKSGFVITMLVSSLADDVNNVKDVEVDDELEEIIKTFEPTLNS